MSDTFAVHPAGRAVIGKNATADDVTIGLCFPIGCLLVAGVMLALVKLPRVAAPGDTTKLVSRTSV
ncbi:hypothetical protein ACFW9U_00870 [Rhodococcus aetherivorans]|uniref:hypothetical protein n=1 Tax=Rhodococcus aetherivorans TaxID=191292 RepID=UPI00366CFFA4